MADRRVGGVDELRAAAALAVFFCHLSAYWMAADPLPSKLPELFELAAHGVDLFVVISGFCLALPFLATARPLEPTTFLRRRAWRLLPPYYVALAGAAILAFVPSTARYTVGSPATIGDLAAHVGLVQPWSSSSIDSINGSLWSISLEAHLYLVFPLLFITWRRVGARTVMFSCALVSVLWSTTALWDWGPAGWNYVLPARLVQFAGGVLCAQLYIARRVPRRSVLTAGVVLGSLVAAAMTTANIEVGAAVVWTVPSAFLVLLATTSGPAGALRELLARFGAVSFSFYLVHQPLLLLMAPVATRVTRQPVALLALGGTVAVAIVLAVAVLMHRTVELPSQARGRRSGVKVELVAA